MSELVDELPKGWRRAPLDHGLVTESLATVLDRTERIKAMDDEVMYRAWLVLEELYERMKHGSASVQAQ